MKKILTQSLIAFCLGIGCLGNLTGCNPTSLASSSQPITIYAVTTGADTLNAAVPSMQPIVVLKDGKFEDPLPEANPNASSDEYDKAMRKAYDTYFAPDGVYNLFRFGKIVGNIGIPKAPTDSTTDGLRTGIKLKIPNVTYPLALASNSDQFSKSAFNVRDLSGGEQAELTQLSRTLFTQNGISGGLLDSVDVKDMKVFDVDGKGTQTAIGNVVIVHHETKKAEGGEGEEGDAFVATLEENIFLVAEKQGGHFVAIQTHFMPSSSDNADLYSQDFIDMLDVDSDGVGEIVVVENGYESYSFAILKRKGGKWEEMYKGSGGSL